MKNFLKNMATGPDNLTYDPARVIGYSGAAMGILTFLFNAVWSVTHGAAWDAQAYGVGLCAVLTGVCAVGAGVALKSKTEPSA